MNMMMMKTGKQRKMEERNKMRNEDNEGGRGRGGGRGEGLLNKIFAFSQS